MQQGRDVFQAVMVVKSVIIPLEFYSVCHAVAADILSPSMSPHDVRMTFESLPIHTKKS